MSLYLCDLVSSINSVRWSSQYVLNGLNGAQRLNSLNDLNSFGCQFDIVKSTAARSDPGDTAEKN
jgi:hypothetical protein